MYHFNPRSREGSDNFTQRDFTDRDCISIHAPARGATDSILGWSHTEMRFQSTLPRGERLGVDWDALIKKYDFNPRSREGSDFYAERAGNGSQIFQSTLPRGERLDQLQSFDKQSNISIHAPARGATSLSERAFLSL